MKSIRRWRLDRAGSSSVEYALIASLVAAVVIVGITYMATGTNSLYGRVGTAFNTHILPGQ